MKNRTFTHDDQLAFAELSGDHNPMHVDELAARRLMFGRPVVHGVHLLLWALDCWCEGRRDPLDLCSLRVDFLRPVRVGDSVRLVSKEGEGNQEILTLLLGKSTVTKISFQWVAADSRRPECGVSASLPGRSTSREWSVEEIRNAKGALDLFLDEETARRLVPNVTRLFAPLEVAVILATTRLVGMECPGQHSVYSQLVLRFDEVENRSSGTLALVYSVATFDSRFNLVVMDLKESGITGSVRAFLRPPPRKQAAYAEAQRAVERGEFDGQRALVVGGSRGLGEVAAKLLAAGGAEVRITYFRGAEDARQVVDEIRAGGGVADSLALDVLSQDGEEAATGEWKPTHLYYFATPFIEPGEKGTFSADRFDEFCRYYVTGFARLFTSLVRQGLEEVFYPSSVFVEELPENMGEYAIAKAAGETLCDLLGKTHRNVSIHRPRLPRLATDQTASLSSVENLDPLPLLLEQLRSSGAFNPALSGGDCASFQVIPRSPAPRDPQWPDILA